MLCWRDLPLISHGGCLPPARPPPGVFHGFIVGASAMWIAVSSVRYRTVLPLRYARCRILTKRDKKSCGIMGALRKIAQCETAVLWERYERYSGSATINIFFTDSFTILWMSDSVNLISVHWLIGFHLPVIHWTGMGRKKYFATPVFVKWTSMLWKKVDSMVILSIFSSILGWTDIKMWSF